MTDQEKIADLELQVLTLKSHFVKLRSECTKRLNSQSPVYKPFSFIRHLHDYCERVLNEC